tara:strand:- start:43655 stop:44275 length:621 start_codon:yes stop_codon:yes gene_type:complete
MLLSSIIFASGGFDNGTSTGKDKIQFDLTWNPFNYFKDGQNYIVLSYGLTNSIDLHGYYADHSNYENGVDSYYYGILYQFLDSKHLDLGTAIGRRKMMNLEYAHYFFPQLLYNIKLFNEYSIGGSIVNIKKENTKLFIYNSTDWVSFDVALFIPITRYLEKFKKIESVKFGIGLFKTKLYSNEKNSDFMPTYSIDIKLNCLIKQDK